MPEALRRALAQWTPGRGSSAAVPTFKWKVAVREDGLERRLLEDLLHHLPQCAKLRLDANGGWDRRTAGAWADRLAREPRLQWLEQPLPATDLAGLVALADRLPVALDESLQLCPDLRRSWLGWQVRRPSQEGDPRPLLRALEALDGDADPQGRVGSGCRMALSTAFETGIGARWLAHLAALQDRGSHPAAPGLAPGWLPPGDLMSRDPDRVWAAAR
jgi:O-succinylbenzoate synthase